MLTTVLTSSEKHILDCPNYEARKEGLTGSLISDGISLADARARFRPAGSHGADQRSGVGVDARIVRPGLNGRERLARR